MSWRAVGLGALVAVLVGGAGAGGYAATRHGLGPLSAPARTPPPSPTGVLTQVTAPPFPSSTTTAPEPSPATLAAALRRALADPHLGQRTLVEVRDALSGAVLLARDPTTATAPASTAKLATAVAVLATHAPADRVTTRVVAGTQPGTVVLVGGGDPTLTAAPPGHTGAYGDAARIADLAAQLHGVRRVVVDDRLFTGPAVSPYWAPEDVPSDYAAPITAAMIDGGRDEPSATTRSTAPDLAAARALATALGVHDVTRGAAPAHARTLATVRSAPIGTLVEQMLQTSDNVIAECLARVVAIAEHEPASYAGAAAGVRKALQNLGVDLGAGMVDGSGLAARDRLTPDALTRVLALVTGAHPGLRGILDDLPVAAWSGTLADRYRGSAGAGVVRAKTGTLTSVSTLAGLVPDADGRLLIFAAMADRVGPSTADTAAAEAALDRLAATLATVT